MNKSHFKDFDGHLERHLGISVYLITQQNILIKMVSLTHQNKGVDINITTLWQLMYGISHLKDFGVYLGRHLGFEVYLTTQQNTVLVKMGSLTSKT